MSKLLDLIEQTAYKSTFRSQESMTPPSTSSGINFTGALTILFVGLKLSNVINWSWWWVLSPIWISLLLVLGILAIIVAIAFISEI